MFQPDNAPQDPILEVCEQQHRADEQNTGGDQRQMLNRGAGLSRYTVDTGIGAEQADLLAVDDEGLAVGIIVAVLVVNGVDGVLVLPGLPGTPHDRMLGRIFIGLIAEHKDFAAVSIRRRHHGGVKHIGHGVLFALGRVNEVDITEMELLRRVNQDREPVFKAPGHVKALRGLIKLRKGDAAVRHIAAVMLPHVVQEGGTGNLHIRTEVNGNLQLVRMTLEPGFQESHVIAVLLHQTGHVGRKLFQVVYALPVIGFRHFAIDHIPADYGCQQRKEQKQNPKLSGEAYFPFCLIHCFSPSGHETESAQRRQAHRAPRREASERNRRGRAGASARPPWGQRSAAHRKAPPKRSVR